MTNHIINRGYISDFVSGENIYNLVNNSYTTEGMPLDFTNTEILYINDGGTYYILGETQPSRAKDKAHIYNLISESEYGFYANDLYNRIADTTDFSTETYTNRTVYRNSSHYIGQVFHSGSIGMHGFVSDFWHKRFDVDSSKTTAPLAPGIERESFFVMTPGGNKYYQYSSGTIIESSGMRINVGTQGTDIHQSGTWTSSTLSVQSIDSKLRDTVSTGGYPSFITPIPNSNEFQIVNFTDQTMFGMYSGSFHFKGGNVGIGMSSPDSPVHISYDSSTTTLIGAGVVYEGLTIENINTTSGVFSQLHLRGNNFDSYIRAIWSGTTNVGRIGFFVDNTNDVIEAMSIANDGNVGIGTSNPLGSGGSLHLSATANEYGFIHSKAQIHLSENAYYNSGWKSLGDATNRAIVVQTNASNNEALRVAVDTSAGSLGTALSFQNLFLVKDNGVIQANGRFQAIASGGGSADLLHLREDTDLEDFVIRYNGSGSWDVYSELGAGGTHYLTINTTGLGVGRSPSYKLDVNGNIRGGYLLIDSVYIDGTTVGTTSSNLTINPSGLVTYGDGHFDPTSTVWDMGDTTTYWDNLYADNFFNQSARHTKSNIVYMDDINTKLSVHRGLDIIKSLKPAIYRKEKPKKEYKYIEEEDTYKKMPVVDESGNIINELLWDYGVIVNDIPLEAHKKLQLDKIIEYDEQGNPISVSYIKMIPLLLQAVKELADLYNTLTTNK